MDKTEEWPADLSGFHKEIHFFSAVFDFDPELRDDIHSLNRLIRRGLDPAELKIFSLSKLVNQVDGYNKTAIGCAAARGNVHAVRTLLKHDIDLRLQGLKAMALAARHGHLEILELLLPKVVAATYYLKTYYDFTCSLHEAAFGRQYDIAKWAIDRAADINNESYGLSDKSPIQKILQDTESRKDPIPLFQLFLHKGAKIPSSDKALVAYLSNNIEKFFEQGEKHIQSSSGAALLRFFNSQPDNEANLEAKEKLRPLLIKTIKGLELNIDKLKKSFEGQKIDDLNNYIEALENIYETLKLEDSKDFDLLQQLEQAKLGLQEYHSEITESYPLGYQSSLASLFPDKFTDLSEPTEHALNALKCLGDSRYFTNPSGLQEFKQYLPSEYLDSLTKIDELKIIGEERPSESIDTTS